MHKEYAVDPATIASSYDNFRYLIEKFGFDRGRLISKFPSKWERLVYQAADEFMPTEKTRLEIRLKQLRGRVLVGSGRTYVQTESWLHSALEAHEERPFHAIISDSPCQELGCLIRSAQCEETHHLLAVPTANQVRRTQQDLGAAASFLLQSSQFIKFVDPYFDPRPPNQGRNKWLVCLQEFLRIIHLAGRTGTQCEYHFCEKGTFPQQFVPSQRQRLPRPSAQEFQENCLSWISPYIPQGMSVTFYRWREKDNGEQFHARYILTEKGGLSIDAGLDRGRMGQTTDITLMEPSLKDRRWAALQPTSDVYELVGPVLQVDSTGRVTEVVFPTLDLRVDRTVD